MHRVRANSSVFVPFPPPQILSLANSTKFSGLCLLDIAFGSNQFVVIKTKDQQWTPPCS